MPATDRRARPGRRTPAGPHSRRRSARRPASRRPVPARVRTTGRPTPATNPGPAAGPPGPAWRPAAPADDAGPPVACSGAYHWPSDACHQPGPSGPGAGPRAAPPLGRGSRGGAGRLLRRVPPTIARLPPARTLRCVAHRSPCCVPSYRAAWYRASAPLGPVTSPVAAAAVVTRDRDGRSRSARRHGGT